MKYRVVFDGIVVNFYETLEDAEAKVAELFQKHPFLNADSLYIVEA